MQLWNIIKQKNNLKLSYFIVEWKFLLKALKRKNVLQKKSKLTSIKTEINIDKDEYNKKIDCMECEAISLSEK